MNLRPPSGLTLIIAMVLGMTSANAERLRVVGYVPNWIQVPAFAKAFEYDRVTHLNIAFENPINDQGDLSFAKGNDALVARAREQGVKILVSIGGGSASEDKIFQKRYRDLLSDARRPGFVAKLAAFVAKHDLDGLDVDIEGPAISEDYGDFIRDLSAILKPRGQLLTAALSQGYGGDQVPVSVFEHLDFINIMAYDATGPWKPESPGPHSSLEFAKTSVTWWLDRGLPKDKVVLGVPFYGYGFGKDFRRGDYSYRDLVVKYPKAVYADQAGETIWFNGSTTIRDKCRFVRDGGLGGVMIWSLDKDAAGKYSLLKVIHETLSIPRVPK